MTKEKEKANVSDLASFSPLSYPHTVNGVAWLAAHKVVSVETLPVANAIPFLLYFFF